MASMIFSFDGLKQQKETENIVRKEKIHQIRKEMGPKRTMQKADETKINRKYWRDRKCATVGYKGKRQEEESPWKNLH